MVNSPVYFVLLLPLLILVMYVTIVLTSLIFSKVLLIVVNTIHQPKEGVFQRVIIGQASIIQSTLIIGDFLIIKKIKIGNNVKIGAHTVVMPGTQINDNCILAASSVSTVGQQLEEGWIYIGVPAHKYKKNRFDEENIEEKISHVKDIEALRDKYEEIYFKWYDDDISWTERKKLRKQKKDAERVRREHDIQ